MRDRRRLLGATLFSLLAILATRAEAALLCGATTCSDSTAFAIGGSSNGGGSAQPYGLAQFDPALGTLDSATLHISGTMFTGLTVMGYNPPDGGEDLLLIGRSSSLIAEQPYFFFHVADLSSPTQIHRILLPSLVRACGPVGADDGCTATLSEQQTRNDLVGLGDTTGLVGTGTFSVFAGAFGLAAFCEWEFETGGFPSPNPNRTCAADYGSSLFGTLAVVYGFTPAATAAVPAPASLAVLIAALLSFAARRSASGGMGLPRTGRHGRGEAGQ